MKSWYQKSKVHKAPKNFQKVPYTKTTTKRFPNFTFYHSFVLLTQLFLNLFTADWFSLAFVSRKKIIKLTLTFLIIKNCIQDIVNPIGFV